MPDASHAPLCPLCSGAGGWEDARLQQSVLCPLCRPQHAPAPALWPAWLDGYERVLARYYGGPMLQPPDMIVVHRAAAGQRVAGYFARPGDGRRVSSQFAWHPPAGDRGDFAQCVSLRREAWHAGGSRWAGDRRLNDNSTGLEAPGAIDAPISDHVYDCTRRLLERLVAEVGSYTAIIGHADGDPANRRDPGKNFDWQRAAGGLGLRCPHLL